MEIVVVLLIIAFVVGTYYFRTRLQYGDLTRRVKSMQQMAATRKFHMPDDLDLNPTLEYMNISIPTDEILYQILIFAKNGILQQKDQVSETEINQTITEGNWRHMADRYLVIAGKSTRMSQYERPLSG